jgi:hypothetical protein
VLGIFTKKINKKKVHPVLVNNLETAISKSNLVGSKEADELILYSLKMTDLATALLVKKHGWDVEAINNHCRVEVVVAFICFFGYLSVKPEKTEMLRILKLGIRTALHSVGIYDGNSAIPKIEIALILAMAKEAKDRNLDIEETLGLKLALENKSSQAI